MMWFHALRTWFFSVIACMTLLAGWSAAMQLMAGRTAHLAGNVVAISLAFGLVFAVVAALLYVPMFSILTIVGTSRRTAVATGAALGVVVTIVLAWYLREFRDAATFLQFVRYAVRMPLEFLAGVSPFVAAGALFGFLWSHTH